ncbi:MAG: YigZ family protein [Corynebacterium sp.]|nr:YigZ family protein [Corynebacterium sp.]
MLNEYRRPKADVLTQEEIEIKRSRFICLIKRIENEAEARDFIAATRAQYPDARHHCSAYIFHQDGAHPIERSSDDGEPSGTAGKPMLDVVKGSQLLDIAAVVVRYFGGVKLGAGGLVHAYSGAVSAAIEQVPTVVRAHRELFNTKVGHDNAGRVEAELRGRGFDITDVDYGAAVTYTIAVEPREKEQLAATLAALTSGTSELRAAGNAWIEI